MADLKSKQIKFPLTGTDIVSSSAQISTDISGSLSAAAIVELGANIVSGSAQIATDISGSFTGELSGSGIKFVGGGVSGSAASSGSFGNIEISNNATIDGDLLVTENIKHKGDVNTLIRFTDNKIKLEAGGMSFVSLHDDDSAPFPAKINPNSERINLLVLDKSGQNLLKTDSDVGNVILFYSGSEKLSTHNTGVNVTGSLTASGDISSSANITANNFSGIFNGALSSSAQISTDISGSFVAPSASFSTRITTDSGSFSTRVTTAESELGNTLVSSSAQLSTDISGSFVEPSASFSTRVTTAETELENTLVSSSAQLSTDISGSFVAPSASFSTRITTAETELGNTLLSGSAQIATDISGSLSAAAIVELGANIVSGSIDGTLSGSQQIASDISGSLSTEAVIGLGAGIISGSSSNSNLTSAIVTEGAGILSGSAQIAGDVSGSFTSGFEFTGKISGSSTSTGSFGSIETDGDINVSGKLAHAGDPDTRILFTDDDINITAGGKNFVDFTEDTVSEITFNEEGVDIDFRIETANDSKALYINAGDDTIQLGSSANTHITASGNISGSAGNILGFKSGSFQQLDAGVVSASSVQATNLVGLVGTATQGTIDHDSLANFVANEHVDHSGVTITAGAGLTGGGTIVSTRTLAVGEGTGVTVNANDVAIGQDVGTDQDVTFASVTATGNIVAQGDVIAENYIVSSSVTFMTSSILSGSTRFGDTPADDTHQFTGSLFVTGSTFNIDENGSVSSSASGSFLNVKVSDNLEVEGKFTLPNITDVSASIASAVAGGDDMGNHTATQDLDMDGNDIFDVGHISSSGNISGSAGDILGFASASFSNIDAPHIKATNVHGTILTATQATIDHDSLANFVANEHIDHSSVSVTAGDGLTGGGTIAANRTINVVGGDGITANANDIAITAAQTTIESIYKEDLVIGEDNQTKIDFETANEIHFDVNNSELLNLTGAKISGSQASTGSFGSLVTDANVGIGESNPNVPLEVIGNVSSSASGSFLNIKASNNVNATNLYGTVLTATQGTIDHDSLANFVANEHIDHSGVTLTAGDGLSGGGTIASNRSFAVDATVLRTTGDSVISSSAQLSTDISGSFVAPSGSFSTRITTAESELGNTLVSSSAQLSADISGSLSAAAIVGLGAGVVSASAMVDHDSTTNFVANEHINHTSVTITAGDGLTGGGTIASTRTLAVGQGTGVTVNANDIAIGQAVETDSNVTFANITATATGSFGKISGSLIESTGDFTLDSSGDIILDADGTDIKLKDGGTEFGAFKIASSDFIIKSTINNKDILFKGQDGGATITALQLDMSEGGNAQFLGNISGSQIEASGDVIAFGSSDRRLKDNITPITEPLWKVSQIGGYEFDWNDKQDAYKGHDVGVVAQEIHKVLPEVVAERSNGYLGVKYEKIVPLLIESIKELNKKIEDIEKKCDCLNK